MSDRLLRARVPDDAFDRLSARADREGLTLGALVRRLLIDASVSDGSDTRVSDERWAALKVWAREHPEVTYDGLKGRAAKMAHAVRHGYVEQENR